MDATQSTNIYKLLLVERSIQLIALVFMEQNVKETLFRSLFLICLSNSLIVKCYKPILKMNLSIERYFFFFILDQDYWDLKGSVNSIVRPAHKPCGIDR